MKTPRTQAILFLSAAIILWLLFFLFLGIFIESFSMPYVPIKESPLSEEEEPIVYIPQETYDISVCDLYSVQWEEKDLARAIAEDNPYISDFEALDLVNMTKEITESTSEIDYRYILSIISVESNFNSEAVSPSGAVGYMQLIPKWFTQKASEHGFSYISPPEENVTLGVEYLDEMYRETDDLRLATMAYNMGLQEAKAIYNGSANWYVQLVESRYDDLVERVS